MEEFVKKLNTEAMETIKRLTHREPEKRNPFLELVAVLVADETGELLPEVEGSLTHSAWMKWNRLAFEERDNLMKMAATIIMEEKTPLPKEMDAMREWAVWLIEMTLDQLYSM